MVDYIHDHAQKLLSDPALLRALVDRIALDWQSENVHFVSVLVPEKLYVNPGFQEVFDRVLVAKPLRWVVAEG